MTNKKKLEALIDALSDSLEIIAHNPVETEYVISLRHKYNEHYKQLTGRYYSLKNDKITEEKDPFAFIQATPEWKNYMDQRFNDVDGVAQRIEEELNN